MNISESSNEMKEGQQRFHSLERWYVDIIFTSLLAAVSFYVLFALIYFQIKKRQNLGSTNRHRYKTERRFATVTKTICILVAVFSLLYDLVKIGMLSIEDMAYWNSITNTTSPYLETVCNHFPKVREITLVMGTGLVYLFLWARQRVFYINPSLKQLNSKLTHVLSYVVVVFWFVYFITLLILLLAVPRYIYLVPGGCYILSDVTRLFQVLVGSLVIACAMLQLTLLWLFINPLINRTSIRGFSAKSGPSRTYKKIYSRVKRALILSLMCLLSDIITVVLVTVLHREDTTNTTLPYSFNLAVNMLATVGCYDNWNTMLFPWCADNKVFRSRFVSSKYSSTSADRREGSTVYSVNNNKTNASQEQLSSINDTLNASAALDDGNISKTNAGDMPPVFVDIDLNETNAENKEPVFEDVDLTENVEERQPDFKEVELNKTPIKTATLEKVSISIHKEEDNGKISETDNVSKKSIPENVVEETNVANDITSTPTIC